MKKRSLKALVLLCGALVAITTATTSVQAAPLKLVVHDETGNEGDAAPEASRFAAVKQAIEKAVNRQVDILVTRDRRRVADMLERNQADLFVTHGTDLAASAMQTLGYTFVAASRPDFNAVFVGKSGPVENLKSLAGKAVAMPRADTMAGQICLAELRDFLGTQFTQMHTREYSGVVWAVENNVQPVGCIPSFAKAKSSLESKGIKVIYEGRPLPATPVIAAASLPASDRAAIAKMLANLDEEGPGRPVLRALGVSSFSEGGEGRVRALPSWLKPK